MSESASLYGSVFAGCPVEWEVVPFADAIDFREGPGILAKDFREKGVPLLRLRNIERPFVDLAGCNFLDPDMVESRWSHFRVVPGDLLVSTSGTLGRVSIATQASAGSIPYTGIIRMRPARVDVDAGFIRYFLMSPLFQLQAEASAAGSVLRHFGPSHLREMSFPVPSSNEQRTIAGVLGALDDKIEQNRRTARALERLARAIFRAWFVDFEPVKAKAAGAASFSSMPQPDFDALPTRFVDTDIGPVPEGWEVKAIGDVVTTKGGGTPSTKNPEYWDDGEHCWVTPKDMSRLSHPVLLDTERRITEAAVNSISSGMLPVGTVLMSSRAPVGYLAIAKVPTAINQGFIAMVCDGPLPSTYVLNWALTSMDAIKARASGTTFPEISKKNFRPLPVVLPQGNVIAAYQKTSDPLFDLLEACVKENLQLTQVRDFLLPQLLSGTVRVRS
ncbi:MAG: restriction endonuclease subunit S [Chromatiales bacterium]|nr:restriction endonuclease subunit S [Chromatiales bacterium]